MLKRIRSGFLVGLLLVCVAFVTMGAWRAFIDVNILEVGEIRALKVGNAADRVLTIGQQGTPTNIYDAAILNDVVVLTGTTVGGYNITGPSQGNFFVLGSNSTIVDTSTTMCPACLSSPGGVTVTYPVPTAATDGWEFTVAYGGESAASEYVLYNGLPIGDASGLTPYASNTSLDLDAVGDTITIVLDYDSEVSAWVKNYHIQ